MDFFPNHRFSQSFFLKKLRFPKNTKINTYNLMHVVLTRCIYLRNFLIKKVKFTQKYCNYLKILINEANLVTSTDI